MKRIRWSGVVAAFVATVLFASTAFAAVYIYEGKGVGATRLGWRDHTAATKLSSRYHKYTRDTRYSYTVYHWYVGKRMSNRRYPIELWAKGDHKVFQYQVNSSAYPSAGENVRVGSTESYLRSKYPGATRRGTSVFTVYTVGSKHPTVFNVKRSTHRVFSIVVR